MPHDWVDEEFGDDTHNSGRDGPVFPYPAPLQLTLPFEPQIGGTTCDTLR